MKVGEPACRVKSQGNGKTVIGRARAGEAKLFQLISSNFIHRTDQTSVSYTFKISSTGSLLCKTEYYALPEHDNSIIITTNVRYHQRFCLEAWHMNSTHVLLNRDDET